MFASLCILGRQPALGLAELESLFGPTKIQPIADGVVLIDADPASFPIQQLGGTMKVAKYIAELPYTDWGKIETYLAQELPKHTCCRPAGKIRLGINAYNFKLTAKRINATGLMLKKAIRNPVSGEGRSVRVIPNKEPELNTAQVIHNQLTGPTGFDLILVRSSNKTILAQTTAVQDITAYAARDQKRPARDARVGMLPPKLAQIIINLAVSKRSSRKEEVYVLDPFCGTGVLLQEALLMGYFAMGADLDPRMVKYTTENLRWLDEKFKPEGTLLDVEVADATNAQWSSPFNTIAGETYLGRPFSSLPKPEVLTEVMQDVDTIHRKFLMNIARHPNTSMMTKHGHEFRLCIAVPVWKTKNGFKRLKTLDNLEELGYTRISFVHAKKSDLIYHRDGQVVGRELVVLKRK